MKRILLVVLGVSPMVVFGQSAGAVDRNSESYWSGNVAAGFGQDVLGSEDVRRGGLYGVSYSTPWNRLRYKNNRAQVVVSGYYMFTKGGGYDYLPVNHLHTYGISAAARYWNHIFKGTETFFDFGWGLSYGNKMTIDLSSRVNSTPFLGVGAVIPGTDGRLLATVRWFHMSDAGTKGNNQGLNQIQYGLSWRF